MPPDIAICVKEHPSQFNARMIGHQGRTARFYKAATAISGVKLVAETVSSAKLILNAQAVATISGTVALEAAILGKRGLVFGGVWIDGCPNLLRFTRDLSWKVFSLLQFLIVKKLATGFVIGWTHAGFRGV